MSSVNEIRSAFLDFFHQNGHEIVPSSPLVPHNDLTLMFANAGMVQFKNVFTGFEQRPYNRVATAQKCVRAGGKHNDLDNVGYTARHHTFFEMLGNFSFGDYFKEEAIRLTWDLLIKEFGLKKEKLLVTVYHDDADSIAYWKKIAGLNDHRIVRIASSDNFWSMGNIGPCGPCSEIFYDHGPKIAGGPPGSKNAGGDRFTEIWNLVFMQYAQTMPGQRIDLPRLSIDTGMGLERISAVLQGVHDNYDIDLFRALICTLEEVTGVKAEGEFIASHRVIVDHLRSSAFLIADGVLPSNEGRGYVLRRIMRRAIRHAQLLGTKEPLMWQLLPALVREMGQAYPELVQAESLISETLQLEEIRFRKTLERGLSLFENATRGMRKGSCLDGRVAFKLYDTYGFPFDLTQEALRQRGIGLDIDGFNKAMQRQKTKARANWFAAGESAVERVWFTVRDKLEATEFLGYDTERAEGIVKALVRNNQIIDHADIGEECAVIVNRTPFYGESGGQVGDVGTIFSDDLIFEVSDTKKKGNGFFVHIGLVKKGWITIDQVVDLRVDSVRRAKICLNHSATHLLHKALYKILGKHIIQKGSLVTPERLRFDFSHPKAMTCEELTQVEDLANGIVLQNKEVTTRLMAVDNAIAEGAVALFSEKYGDKVRVVSMGYDQGKDGQYSNHSWSLELCGGTHVNRTGDIGLIRIVSEGAVASGVRRIEALTGQTARQHLIQKDKCVRAIAAALKSTPETVEKHIHLLMKEHRNLKKKLSNTRSGLVLKEGDTQHVTSNNKIEMVNGIFFVGQIVYSMSSRELKSLVDIRKKQLDSAVVVFISIETSGKATIVVGVTSDLIEKISAVDLVHIGSETFGGRGGGGRADIAQAGGPNGTKAEKALAKIRQKLEKL
ncbi:MAG: alanyl-tRNA synthetase [Candidatus Tokpelaia sp. JSC188]|nr:MAG: alanyl-tRNA synthetase [Candidatus Tokpelaia sp. JSC188]